MPKQPVGFGGILVCVAAFAMASALAADDEGLPWLSDYREAIRQARLTKRPVFLEFRCEP